MKLDEMVTRMAAHEAAAAALRAEIERAGHREYLEKGVATTWRLPGAQVIVSASKPRVVITDQGAFTSWLAAAYPDEVVRREVIEPRNPTWVKRLLEELASRPSDVQYVQGVRFDKGRQYRTTSVRLDRDVTDALAASAKLYAAGQGSMPELDARDKSTVD